MSEQTGKVSASKMPIHTLTHTKQNININMKNNILKYIKMKKGGKKKKQQKTVPLDHINLTDQFSVIQSNF